MEEPPSNQNLFEINTLENIFLPVRNAPRVKYTCFAVSMDLLVLGATSGSLYAFRRDNLDFLSVIPNKEGPVNVISIDGTEQHIAFATSRGSVVILEHNLDDSGGSSSGADRRSQRPIAASSSTRNPRRVQLSREHQGAVVTALQWSSSGGCLFVADDCGTVTAINITTNKAQTLFNMPSSTVVRLSSRIVQLDFLHDKLLISTLTGCYICDTSKEQYTQIGSKPRDGEFGACFSWRVTTTNQKNLIIYATRPGSRLWEADFDGNVLYTHQLKNALARPMEPLVSVKQSFHPTSRNKGTPQSLNFGKLFAIGENHLLTWFESRLFILDTSSMSVSLSVELSEAIADVRLACYNEVYVRHANNQLRCFRLLPVEVGLRRLLVDSRWELCGMACIFYESHVTSAKARKWLPRSALQELENHLRLDGSEELAERVRQLLIRLQESQDGAEVERKHHRLESGIYVVNMPENHVTKDWRLLSKHAAWADGSRSANSSPEGSLHNVPISGRRSEDIKENTDDAIMYMPYSSTVSWDVDASYGYLALASMKHNVSLGEIKNSLSSKYKSGKKRILNTMGKLEEHLKVQIGTEGMAEPFDVQRNIIATDSRAMFIREKQDSTIFPKKAFDLQNYEEKAFAKHTQNIQPDFEPFFGATGEAWDKLQNPKILCDANRMKVVLERWVNALHSTQESWYRALACQAKPKFLQSKSCSNFLNDDDSKAFDSETTVHLESSKRTVSSENMESIALEDACQNQHDLQLDSFTLEDVLWWQDVTLLTSKANIPSSQTECWLCSPKYFAGNAWKLASPQKETIMQLVSMCIRTKTFGRIAVYCESHQSWTRIDSLDIEEEEKESCSSTSEAITRQHPLVVVKMSDVTLDRARSLFIRQYFGLVRPDVVFQDIRSDTQWSCNSWQCILNGIMATSSGVSSSNLARGLHCDLRLMNPFLAILRSDTRDASTIVNKLLEVNDKVYCRDVLYLDQTMNCQNGLFLSYMDSIHRKTSKNTQEDVKQQHERDAVHGEDHLLEAAWVQLMLQDEPRRNDRTSKCLGCAKPTSFSHAQPWKWQDQLVSVLQRKSDNGSLLLELCEEHGFWLGKLHLLNQLGSRPEMFQHFVQLGDIDLFRDTNTQHLLPTTVQEWEFLFKMVIDYEGCGNCYVTIGTQQPAKRISVDDVAWLMLRHCDAGTVIAMLQKLISWSPIAKLSLSFYRSCILSAAARQQQSNDLAFSILKKTDANVWSKRAHYASPQVKTLLLEKDGGSGSDISEKSDVTSRSRLLEDSQCHWGVRLDLASYCHVCFLPLGLLSSNDGVRIYPCGHGYHKRCAITERCVACVQSSNFGINSTNDPGPQNSS